MDDIPPVDLFRNIERSLRVAHEQACTASPSLGVIRANVESARVDLASLKFEAVESNSEVLHHLRTARLAILSVGTHVAARSPTALAIATAETSILKAIEFLEQGRVAAEDLDDESPEGPGEVFTLTIYLPLNPDHLSFSNDVPIPEGLEIVQRHDEIAIRQVGPGSPGRFIDDSGQVVEDEEPGMIAEGATPVDAAIRTVFEAIPPGCELGFYRGSDD